ncbi:MAG TPA: hypothetical protein VGK06_03480, partial [Methanosarcina sp.]
KLLKELGELQLALLDASLFHPDSFGFYIKPDFAFPEGGDFTASLFKKGLSENGFYFLSFSFQSY